MEYEQMQLENLFENDELLEKELGNQPPLQLVRKSSLVCESSKPKRVRFGGDLMTTISNTELNVPQPFIYASPMKP